MTRVVIMGVAGSGKSTVGRSVAQRLGWPFLDGDDLHSVTAIATMASGQPLGEHERDLWIERLRAEMQRHADVVVACSALRRRHRRLLRSVGSVQMYFLDVPVDELERRLGTRAAHFFPAGLLDSQLVTLEPVRVDEPVLVVDGDRPPGVVTADIVAAVEHTSAGSTDV